ncbi:MAG: sialate O-acetylesterase [Lachnospiraceae bacterium]|nr:sialate O-acetylesterase [Lachnospiraceae bacterium]
MGRISERNSEVFGKDLGMRLAAIFSDSMVLQRDKEVNVFGETGVYGETGDFVGNGDFGETGRSGERAGKSVIKVTIDNISVEKEVPAGKFVITLPAHPAGGPYTMTVTDRSEPGKAKVIRDVYYGEVWIDNGQSNIEFELQNARGGEEELSSADLPLVRYFKCIKTPVIDESVLLAEQNLCWTPLMGGKFRDMSGVAYYFAKKLHGDLSVPVGMVDCYQGGTSISCWLSEERLSAHPEGQIYIDAFEKAVEGQTPEDYSRKLLTYNQMVADYLERERAAKAKNPDITPEELSAEAGDYPWPPPMGLESAFRPSGLYHTMLERIMPYTSRGILYYQGEEDSGKAAGYSILLKELIDEFRSGFSDEKLPVVILQLPMFISRNTEDARDWAYLREAQAKAVMETDGTCLIPLIDLGEYDNVHPVDKKSPGERTETEVLFEIYKNTDIGYPHAELDYAERYADGIVLHFKNTFGKLRLKENELIDIRKETESGISGSRTDGSNEISGNDTECCNGHIYGFEVRLAGRDDLIVPEAKIEGDTVVLSADGRIEEIRYGFFNYGKVNLYNGAGLPVAPLRRES